jgi:hypothetical protein
MVTFGQAPILECSSKGDKRFSAFFARIRFRQNKSIEELYQARKLFEGNVSGLSIQEAKGKKPINIEDCRRFYSMLWDDYFNENPQLLSVIAGYGGFSDIFGKSGHACQAEEVYRIARERIPGYGG